jgi:L-threonylcarbamoyladenylate synthase
MSNSEIILYPTESVYGLGVNPFDTEALERLYQLKGRVGDKPVSWLVRSVADIERYALVNDTARKLAEHFLPGPLTLVLTLRPSYLQYGASDGTIGFRMTTDPVAIKLIEDWFNKHDAPLTATSANVSGLKTHSTAPAIMAQFGDKSSLITTVVDDGSRFGLPSTVVRVNNDGTVTILRESAIAASVIDKVVA